jgi:hypothetical protein
MLYMQGSTPASSFSFADITHCTAFKVNTIQLSGVFVMDLIYLQLYSLNRSSYLWVPLEVILRTASYACLHNLRSIMIANPTLGRVALEHLNWAWEGMYGAPPDSISPKTPALYISVNRTPLFIMFKYVELQTEHQLPKTLYWRAMLLE